jgi:hypothetical protein
MKKFTCSSGKNYASGGRVESSKPATMKAGGFVANTKNPDFGKTDMKTMIGSERKGKC